jgi:peptide/nickel transport system ATP-binding protein
MVVQDIVEEGMVIQGVGGSRPERQARVDRLLEQVGLGPEIKRRYPHEFSGGQRQRICIARALSLDPKLIICDEPTSALDVSVQAQILNLLKRLQEDLRISYLFITHNLAVVAYLAQEVAVMYLGRIVEQGTVDEVLDSPKHPYTQALLAAVPEVHSPMSGSNDRGGPSRSPDSGRERTLVRLNGDLPSPIDPPQGCHFRPRCPHAMPVCEQRYPEPAKTSTTHSVHCFLYGRR